MSRAGGYFYLALLCLLAIITYLDRVCISVAGPRIQEALHLRPEQWGWVGTAFLVGYAVFEIPTGHLGDRIGARRVLTRIVLWWSAFTALTGAITLFPLLLVVRFLFGAGEAGAFPNAAVAISRWFSTETRGRAFGLRGGAVAGFMNTAGQVGGAVASVVFGYLVKATGSYDAPFVPMAALLATGFVLWMKVDVNRKIPAG